MWTPYDWEIEAVKRDIRTCGSVRRSLESARRSVDGLEGNVSSAQANLNQCFGVGADSSSFAEPVRSWFDSALSSLRSTTNALEDKLAALEGSQRAYIQQAEAAERERQQWLRDYYARTSNTYWNW